MIYMLHDKISCIQRVSGSYKNIEIDSDMTCVDVIREALQKFGVEVSHICFVQCLS